MFTAAAAFGLGVVRLVAAAAEVGVVGVVVVQVAFLHDAVGQLGRKHLDLGVLAVGKQVSGRVVGMNTILIVSVLSLWIYIFDSITYFFT